MIRVKCIFLFSACFLPIILWAESSVNPSQFVSSILQSSVIHKIEFSETKTVQDYAFVTSSLKKVNGQWRFSQGAATTGNMTQATYSLNESNVHDLAEVITSTAKAHNFSRIFDCKTLACGRSYAWATEIFHSKLLHGKDTHQYYWVWQKEGTLVSVYLTERSNRRVYLHVVQVSQSSGASTPKDVVDSALWDQQGYALITAPFNTHSMNELVGWLASHKAKNIAVIGHDHSPELNALQKRQSSLEQAEVVMSQLRDEFTGQAFGFGGLVIRKELIHAGLSGWVEVVIE